jgi:hypothetical protein
MTISDKKINAIRESIEKDEHRKLSDAEFEKILAQADALADIFIDDFFRTQRNKSQK